MPQPETSMAPEAWSVAAGRLGGDVVPDTHEVLLLPGPVTVDDRVLAALGQPVTPHYGADWASDYEALCRDIARVYRTDSDVILLFGPGTAALEMAMRSVLAPAEEILIPTNGRFGERLVEIATGAGLTVRSLAAPQLQPLDASMVHAALDAWPRISAMAVVHHETGIGLVNPVGDLCWTAHERGLTTIVDAVSSVGGIPLEVDAWGIDLCIGVANKCLGAPVGVAPVSVSDRAWALAQRMSAERKS
jgi:alanine-glyoxylate transaminase / serine-glyoxylate transaminase / serine-pyruvate transaminase